MKRIKDDACNTLFLVIFILTVLLAGCKQHTPLPSDVTKSVSMVDVGQEASKNYKLSGRYYKMASDEIYINHGPDFRSDSLAALGKYHKNLADSLYVEFEKLPH